MFQDGEDAVASWELRVEGRFLDEVSFITRPFYLLCEQILCLNMLCEWFVHHSA